MFRTFLPAAAVPGCWIQGLNTRLIRLESRFLKMMPGRQKKVSSNLPVGTRSRSINKGPTFVPKMGQTEPRRLRTRSHSCSSALFPPLFRQSCPQSHLVATTAKVFSEQQSSLCHVCSFDEEVNIFWNVEKDIKKIQSTCCSAVKQHRAQSSEHRTELHPAHTETLPVSGHYVLANCY